MAKRLSTEEKPYRPVQERLRKDKGDPPDMPERSLVASVLSHNPAEALAKKPAEEEAPPKPTTREEPQPETRQPVQAREEQPPREKPRTTEPAARTEPSGAGETEDNIVAFRGPASPAPSRTASDFTARRTPERTPSGFEPHNRHLRFKILDSQKAEIDELINRHAAAAGTTLSLSHIMRAWLDILRHAETQTVRALERAHLRRPANEDHLGLAEFERELAHVLLEALRKAPPMLKREAE